MRIVAERIVAGLPLGEKFDFVDRMAARVPVGSVRFTTAPVPIGDVVVPARAIVRISTMSAMRDPHLYRDPERSRTGRRGAEPDHGPAPAPERHRRHPPDYTDGGAYRMTRTAPGGAGPGTTRGTAIAAPDPRCVSRRDAERHG
ncbi:cytochrome P450 [Acuticoccus sp. I52.16.1]|uniref:cytochrome P450 n=1 Tax=Acuticoccus sp. I52.16.1 TaxID=2928472 RepID=UPI001FD3059E|nr:cytochrome P450 [Acuticoccus sp. I52.16.1]UOM34095.1 cytochrome P450 [Acuticoccus sp. I52.16.1]